MNKLIKVKLLNVLKAEARQILNSSEDIQIKLEKMDDIFNLQKVINNYDELQPVLKKFFAEKIYKDKLNERD